jgi:ketosteroid isomerase-like protein
MPVVALDAVDRDGHQLGVLVDGDGDIGLRGAGGEQHQTGESYEEGTHFTLASGP